MDRPRPKPTIYQVGKVEDLPGGGMLITGWGLGWCTRQCPCHRHPVSGRLSLRTGSDASLGLFCYWLGGHDCCEPWTADELAAIVRDLADIAAMAAQ